MSFDDDTAHKSATPAEPLRKDVKMESKEETPVSPSKTLSPNATGQDDDLMTKVFQFLSTATPGTLGAVAVGLAAVTYFILGQIGLLLIGAFGGIVSFVYWESQQAEVSRAVRGERGYDFLDRILETKAQLSEAKPKDGNKNENAQLLAQSFDDFQPETRQALNNLVDAVIRDYVNWWYGPIVPSDDSFPLSCRKVLVSFLLSVSNHLSRKRPADALVDFLTNTCSIIIVFFSEMTAAYSSVQSDSSTSAADAIYGYLASNTDSPLSNLVNQRQQVGKFKMVAEDLLGYLDRPVANCDPARIFLREILATIILEGTLQSCSKAEWVNGWIVYLLESGETDLSQAIDEAMQDQKAFVDVDGNFGNISLSKGNRNSYEMARKKELAHKKKLSKADEEMERAMEEMKKLNEMIAAAEKAHGSSKNKGPDASGILDKALQTNAKELDLKVNHQASELFKSTPSESQSSEIRGITREEPAEGLANKEQQLNSPISSRSTPGTSSHESSPYQKPEASKSSGFTSFDQLVPPGRDDPEDDDDVRKTPPLTLHNANITIHDDPGNDKGRLRSKPTWEYLIQIEPAASQHPGWMVMKTYPQFESLHESLRRLANISGATAFLEAHAAVPGWKVHTRGSLRGEIERYLRSACAEKPLAESEALKRFLEKGQDAPIVNKGFSFESMGKGMLDAIQSAPKGALDGGKVVVGGVTGVFGNIGLGGRKSTSSSLQESQMTKTNDAAIRAIINSRPVSMPVLPKVDTAPAMKSRDSLDSQRSSVISTQPGKIAPMERRPSSQADLEADGLQPTRSDRWEQKPLSAGSSRGNSRASSMAALRSPMRSPSEMSISNMKLPPPPDEIADDYDSPTRASSNGLLSPQSSFVSPFRAPEETQQSEKTTQSNHNGIAKQARKQYAPLSEQETRVAVELLFAVINELYTLSSAWNIRRTLLTAAKTFLIRPGNPSLASIQSLIQDSVIETNTSDAGIAGHLRKIRENSLPTEEERKAWPSELSAADKEELRVKARRLFLQSGVPAALMGIMGQSATAEALGRVFDCLQIEEVARGLFFGIMLQAVRIVTH